MIFIYVCEIQYQEFCVSSPNLPSPLYTHKPTHTHFTFYTINGDISLTQTLGIRHLISMTSVRVGKRGLCFESKTPWIQQLRFL